MPQRKKQPCNFKGCNELTRGSYCDKHKKAIDLKRQHSRSYTDRRYNTVRKTRDIKAYRFYHSNEWQALRKRALIRDGGMCIECNTVNKLTPATEVHHIVPIKEDWNKRFNLNNLKCLCKSCHNKAHNR